MKDSGVTAEDLRDMILSEPEVILRDGAVMAALVEAGDRALGANVIDLRGIEMDRIRARLDRLEETHRTVIAAAYENMAGTNQVHRALLQLLTPATFQAFLQCLGGEVVQTLRVDCARLVLESRQSGDDPMLERLGETLRIAGPGFVARYLGKAQDAALRSVTLRGAQAGLDHPYGPLPDTIRSEALLVLNFGPGRLPGLLALGAYSPHRFSAAQGTDLLEFFGGAFQRVMQRWLT